ncbi:MAG: helix-turn-helix transcriptional regulator [Elusimicrobia bacterium]|nr:helix-turn-helix transcriptional regulator [Elusimicrobiota bacterium]
MKIKNALEIFKKRTRETPRLKTLIEEERVNFQAALTIQQARKKAGLTQVQLAKEIGTTQSVIARLEDANYKGHTLKILEHIAEALGRRVEIKFTPAYKHQTYPNAHYAR